MVQCLPFHYPGTDEDVRKLGRLLIEAFDLADFRPPGRLAVLNLACGRADESGAIASAIAPAQIGFYLGIDLRADAVAEAARRWKLPGGTIEFRCGDATMIGRAGEMPEFDLVFIRHQNYWHDPATWDQLLDHALNRLSARGVMACTSYFDREHDLLLAALKTRGAELLVNLRHPQSRPLPDARGKSVDRHLAVFSPKRGFYGLPVRKGGLLLESRRDND